MQDYVISKMSERNLMTKLSLATLDEPYWGRGYASESVFACVQAGLYQFNLDRILTTILPENIASQKVATKAGLKHTFDAEFCELIHYIYEVRRNME